MASIDASGLAPISANASDNVDGIAEVDAVIG